jgi:hypothetical protein
MFCNQYPVFSLKGMANQAGGGGEGGTLLGSFCKACSHCEWGVVHSRGGGGI